MQKGSIGVTTENIFPIIKKFLYSDHEIFLREIIANAIDATQKLKAVSAAGDFSGSTENLSIAVNLDTTNGTLTVSDRGVGMSAEEVEKYINQIAFSSAGEFLEKYKSQLNGVIGHFGLGFYSSFMVSKKVEVITRSYREGSKAVKWSCDGSPEYTLEEVEKAERGTDVIMYIDDESKEFLEKSRVEGLLKKYCRFLPVEITFGKVTEWKEGKEIETEKDKVINNTHPLWNKKPSEVKEEEYSAFYSDLFPAAEEPLFHIHLNVDFPFNLTGILYFPKIKDNLDISRNKIQLYCNQVFVTDTVESIVPDFLTLLHGVIDSPDIPLNVSRSYLQSDSNVKKISNHITKKVADRLEEIFKNNREEYEKKWDNLKLFIEYGMLTEEKFAERALKFALLKNTEGKYYTLDEYKTTVEPQQTDKENKVVYLYTNDAVQQFSFVEAARKRGYDVLLLDGKLDSHYINHLESKLENVRFARVDADVIDKLIPKETPKEPDLAPREQEELRTMLEPVLPSEGHYFVSFEALSEEDAPMVLTQSEFMRRMREMSAMGGGLNFYGSLPENYTLVVNTSHPLIKRLAGEKNQALGSLLNEVESELTPVKQELEAVREKVKGKKEEEIAESDKAWQTELEEKEQALTARKEEALKTFGREQTLPKQLVDLALLANNLLKGESLSLFIKRSLTWMKE